MPRRYWKNLPEAALIQPLAASAAQRERTMLEQTASEPARRRPVSSKALTIGERTIVVHAPGSLAELHHSTERCR
jgi:DNA polymerase